MNIIEIIKIEKTINENLENPYGELIWGKIKKYEKYGKNIKMLIKDEEVVLYE